MKKIGLFCISLIIICLLAGCGKSTSLDDGKTNIVISKNGGVSYRIRESFAESYYDINELKNMISDEVSAYNAGAGSEMVSLSEIGLENQIATVVMEFKDSKSFESFNGIKLFCGTSAEAIASAQSLSSILTDISDASKTIAEGDLKSLSKEKILIFDGADTVYLPSKVLYVSDNCSVLEGNMAVKRAEGANGAIYVVYK